MIATTVLFLVKERGKDHPEFQKLQQQASSLIFAYTAARSITEDQAQDWLNSENLHDPAHVRPAVQQALIDIVGDTEWLFDRWTD